MLEGGHPFMAKLQGIGRLGGLGGKKLIVYRCAKQTCIQSVTSAVRCVLLKHGIPNQGSTTSPNVLIINGGIEKLRNAISPADYVSECAQ